MATFGFEDCLLKHFIRKEVWLPRCRARLRELRKQKGANRRLKYFTFCAVGALDVLLLDRGRVIQKSEAGEFDTVYFFDRDMDSIVETQKRIPGANGFPGNFVSIVLQADEGDELKTALDSPEEQENTRSVRKRQSEQAQLHRVIDAFPFDVLNLDLEQFIFRPREELPGKLVNAIRKVLDWQKREGRTERGKAYAVQEFTLMFTTQVGPRNLSSDYLAYLRDTCLQQNLDQHEELREPFLRKSNGRDPQQFFEEDFSSAFKLAVPKSLTELAFECDWMIDGAKGIEVFQFDRESVDGPYTMLHMVMTLRRQDPPLDKRPPGARLPAAVVGEHLNALKRLFESDVIRVEDQVQGSAENDLKTDLEDLLQHRQKYYPDIATGA